MVNLEWICMICEILKNKKIVKLNGRYILI